MPVADHTQKLLLSVSQYTFTFSRIQISTVTEKRSTNTVQYCTVPLSGKRVEILGCFLPSSVRGSWPYSTVDLRHFSKLQRHPALNLRTLFAQRINLEANKRAK